MIAPALTSESRLMLIAPHPDDEALACSITLRRVVRAGGAIRVIYATDGDDNPWPQRVLERKWRLNAADRKRWGKLRRAEALAALRILGVRASDARFLGLPDQGLTNLLMRDCRATLEQFAAMIVDWAPTHLLVPSSADTHPDHSALAVMLRLVSDDLLPEALQMSAWSYVVHGKSAAFFDRATRLRQSKSETAIKLLAIRCHKTQIRLSRRRFLAYATRPERLLKLRAREATIADGSIRSIWRRPHTLRLDLRLSVKPIGVAEPTLHILGWDVEEALRCLSVQLPVRSCRIELRDAATERCVGLARYRGNAFAGELTIPIDTFSSDPAFFVKLERRSWFFDEAGWLEIPAAIHPRQIISSNIAQPSLAIR
jgi:LmbE family N-acetylglucosaminyl deacetylase